MKKHPYNDWTMKVKSSAIGNMQNNMSVWPSIKKMCDWLKCTHIGILDLENNS